MVNTVDMARQVSLFMHNKLVSLVGCLQPRSLNVSMVKTYKRFNEYVAILVFLALMLLLYLFYIYSIHRGTDTYIKTHSSESRGQAK